MNTVNWTLWLILAMTYCALTYNPLYQLALFTALAVVTVSHRQPLKAYVKLSLLVSAIPLFVNTFIIHRGDTVLVQVPAGVSLAGANIPLPVLSGNITLESTLTGVIMTVFLVNMLTAFQVYNKTTKSDAILRLMPSSLPGVSLAVAIALRFIPTVVRDHSSIRDAQAARGVRTESGPLVKRMRNHASTLVPTVITSLERGFNLAESMAARGYTGKLTRYRNERWSWREKVTAAFIGLAVTGTVYVRYLGSTDYWPYDSLTLPPISPLALLPALMLLLPALIKDEDS
jgi:energy-coupling factor transport system permease protein